VSLRAALVAALFLPAAGAPAADLPAAVAEVAGLLPGSYVSRDPGASVRVAIAAVPRSRIADGPVFYVEAVRAARPGAPFLQRFLKLEADGPGVAVRIYEPRDLAGVRGKWREPEALALFTPRDVRERPECRMSLAKAPAGHWAGGTAGETCFSAAVDAKLAVTVSLSPQTLEWREEGKGTAGKTVLGPAGEITIYAREREAPPVPAAPALAAPVAGGAAGGGGLASKVNEPAAAAPAVLAITSPYSPSKKYDLAELRAMAADGKVPLSRLVPVPGNPAASVVVATARSGAISVFSFAELSSSSPLSPSLDVSGDAPRLVAPPGRGLDDVVSIELRVLVPAK
jgi:hypothetical protein